MPNITDAIIQQYQHPRIKLVVGATTIYEDDIVSGSFSYRGGVTGGGAFAPGGCVISSCSFTVYNRTGTYTNTFPEKTAVQVYIGYGATPATATYDLLCTVYVSEVSKRNYKISVKAFDKLRDADKKKWTTYSFPMTVNQIIQSAATEAGITVGTLPTYGGSISVDLRDGDGNQPDLNMTCRQAIAQALLISGNFAYVTATGNLYCGWFGSTADVTVPTSWLMDYSISDSQDYTGVQVYGQTPTGSTDRLYVLSSGQFITDDNKASIQSRLYTALVGTNVWNANLSIVCNPNVRPGMLASVTYPMAGSTVTSLIPLTSVTIKGSLRSTYTSDTISADEMDDLRTTGDDGDYATKDYVDDKTKGITVLPKIINVLYEGDVVGNLSASDTVKGYSIDASGILSPLTLGAWTCRIMPQTIIVPSFDGIKKLKTANGDATDNYTFTLRLKVRVSGVTYVGWVDFRAYYPEAKNGDWIRLTIPQKGSDSGSGPYGGVALVQHVNPSTGLITYVPFKLDGVAFLKKGLTDRDWAVSTSS